MVKLKSSQTDVIETAMAFPRGFGYVLDFSDRSIIQFFDEEFQIELEDDKYLEFGTSKRNRLKALIKNENPFMVAKILRVLWERRNDLKRRPGVSLDEAEEKNLKKKFFEIISEIEGVSGVPKTNALENYLPERTLDELIGDIERGIQANKPEATLDHLHTYCIKKIKHLLKIRNVECSEDEPLHSCFGKYRIALEQEQELSEFTHRALKSAISLFESFNHIRNHKSLAHDNIILEHAEARFVFESISAILIFIRAIEAGRYDS